MRPTQSMWTFVLTLGHLAVADISTTSQVFGAEVTVTSTRTHTFCPCEYSTRSATTEWIESPWLSWSNIPSTSSTTMMDATTGSSSISTITSSTTSTIITTTISTLRNEATTTTTSASTTTTTSESAATTTSETTTTSESTTTTSSVPTTTTTTSELTTTTISESTTATTTTSAPTTTTAEASTTTATSESTTTTTSESITTTISASTTPTTSESTTTITSESTTTTTSETTTTTTASTTTTGRAPACPTDQAGIECGPPNGLKYGYNCGAKVLSGSTLSTTSASNFHQCLQTCAAYPLILQDGVYYIQCAYFSFTEGADGADGTCTLYQDDDSVDPVYGYDMYSTRGYWLCQGSNGDYATCDANCPGQEYRKRWAAAAAAGAGAVSSHVNVTLATVGQFGHLG